MSTNTAGYRWGRRMGAVLQGLLLGVLVALALLYINDDGTGSRIFRYERY